MRQTSLIATLGNIACLIRSLGLGSLLDVSRDVVDFSLMKVASPPLRVRVNGFEIYGYFRHRSFLEHISTGKYEAFFRKLFEAALKPDMIVVDAGAHIGLYCLLVAEKIGTNGKVFAFEPDPCNFQALLFNIKENHLDNVIPIQKALSNSYGPTQFYQSSGTISSSLVERTDIGRYTVISADSTTLDKEMQEAAASSLLVKLDIEGAEILALQGMKNTLERTNSVTLLSEVNPHALQNAGFTIQDLISTIEGFGFKVYFIDETRGVLRLVRDLDTIHKGNLYCIK